MKKLIALTFLLFACNRDLSGNFGSDPTGPEPVDPAWIDGTNGGIGRGPTNSGPVCGDVGQPCCTDSPLCLGMLVCASTEEELATCQDWIGEMADMSQPQTPPFDLGAPNDSPDMSEDDCLDPDNGKGDDLHPHGQHRGRVHYCSKQK